MRSREFGGRGPVSEQGWWMDLPDKLDRAIQRRRGIEGKTRLDQEPFSDTLIRRDPPAFDHLKTDTRLVDPIANRVDGGLNRDLPANRAGWRHVMIDTKPCQETENRERHRPKPRPELLPVNRERPDAQHRGSNQPKPGLALPLRADEKPSHPCRTNPSKHLRGAASAVPSPRPEKCDDRTVRH